MQARRALAEVQIHALGGGMMEKDAAEQVMDTLQLSAEYASQRPPKATPSVLDALGIVVVREMSSVSQ